jgi:hypothetical protein
MVPRVPDADMLAAIFFGIIWFTFCLFATKPMRRRMVSTTGVSLISEPALVRVELAKTPAQSLPR